MSIVGAEYEGIDHATKLLIPFQGRRSVGNAQWLYAIRMSLGYLFRHDSLPA